MVTTSDTAVVERIRRLRNYGERVKYDHVVKGVNFATRRIASGLPERQAPAPAELERGATALR
jgi:dTDP-4-amino-4,6-dideoxygalactose transaminase